MKPIKARITRGIITGSMIECADNTGAKRLMVISVKGYKGRHRRLSGAGIGDVVVCSVRRGTQKWRKQVVKAVIIRQAKEFRRADGLRVKFEDNAAVLVNDKGEPQGTQVKGPMAKEVTDRFIPIGKIASFVV
ncbi:50S ribosomal protein L14 [Candidatus Micrarchaeota archaeon RBG_16_49_10]|nr:large subunit ribosomal protein L14 [uncultured archaeon]OGI15371.1 MAG: 50S ribosomal protein L14 [Candidatus Micrarchaeota archaeon RBG_16_49_10]